MTTDAVRERTNSALSKARSESAIVIICASAKGGQGASLLSLYLSSILSASRTTLLIDLDPHSVHRNFLEDTDCPGLANLIMMREGTASLGHEGFIKQHPCGFDLMPGPRCREEWAFLSRLDIEPVVAELSYQYEIIMVDISSNHLPNLLTLSSNSSLNLVIMRPDLISAHSALQLFEEMDGRENGRKPGSALVSNCSRPSPILHPQQLASALRMPLLANLPYDQAAGEDFASLTPVLHDGSPFGISVQRLAVSLGLVESRSAPQERKKPIRCLRALLSGKSHSRSPINHADRKTPGRWASCAE